jgi:alkenylglycerophosphocholine hydrolase
MRKHLAALALGSGVCFFALKPGLGLAALVALKLAPTLCVSLWLIWRLTARDGADQSGFLVLGGLVLSMACDLFMELPGAGLISFGLASNLVASILYAAFLHAGSRKLRLGFLAPPLLVIAGLYLALWGHLGALALPVGLYCLALAVLIWRALARGVDKTVPAASRLLCALGAVLLVASDALLSFWVFGLAPRELWYSAIVMALWWSGLAGMGLGAASLPRRPTR